MPKLRELMAKVLADGRIDSSEIESLSELLYADGVIDWEEAQFLVNLHKSVERVSPAFEKFFYLSIKRHILHDGVIDAKETAWLRSVVFDDGRVSEREKKLIRELRGEASRVCPEFEELCRDCTT
ncbi:MAG: TerB family tellurite resistance protein [Gemmataceae bacterium]|nr:TerB family tellurite resistance protein [Gemmataceae bacterium]